MSTTRLVLTALAVVCFLTLSLFGQRVLRGSGASREKRQRDRNIVYYSVAFGLVLTLVVIWAAPLADAALVASGFAVAIVLFHKEVIVSALGWWLKVASRAYRIGDRVRIGDVRGDVIDYGILSTTLIEVDPAAKHGLRTGNIVTVPNALLLSQSVINETRILEYEWQELEFVVAAHEPWEAAEAVLKEAANDEIKPYRAQIEAQLSLMEDGFAFHPLHVDPITFVAIATDGQVRIQVRMAMPSRRIRSTSDHMTRAFLEWRESTNS
jgi:small-conductance mechanosensitive channel